MSTTLERLRLLRTQAGVGVRANSVAQTATDVPAIGMRAELRHADIAHAHDTTLGEADAPADDRDKRRAASIAHWRTSTFTQPLPPPLAPRRTAATSIADLRRLLGIRARASGSAPPAGDPTDRALPGNEIAPGLRYIEARFAWPDPPAALSIPDRDEPPVQAPNFLAFDTETTGLAGGTGTRAFMIGAADWIDGHVRVRQLCITTLGAETAMLHAFARWLHDDTVLVSYNGRSYDAPLLRTRCRLARIDDMLGQRPHVDLLHPTRRRYRGVWENCRLATIERHLLGIVREDDLPGSQAPGAWLNYLRGGSASLLRRVHAHNSQDVRSLLALLCRLGS